MQTFHSIIKKLNEFWSLYGCITVVPYDFPVGAGTFHPMCFFGTLSQKPFAYCYTQPSTRKADGRYGASSTKLFTHHQFQVVIGPSPHDIQQLYLKSLEFLGINQHHIMLLENNWKSPSLGAFGKGWEALCNHTEITQITYFERMGDLPLKLIPVELAYGIERLAFILNITMWDGDKSYNDIFYEREKQMSKYYIEMNSDTFHNNIYSCYRNAVSALKSGLYYPAYQMLLQMNDIFNSCDARGLLTLCAREEYTACMREISNLCALQYTEQQTNHSLS